MVHLLSDITRLLALVTTSSLRLMVLVLILTTSCIEKIKDTEDAFINEMKILAQVYFKWDLKKLIFGFNALEKITNLMACTKIGF